MLTLVGYNESGKIKHKTTVETMSDNLLSWIFQTGENNLAIGKGEPTLLEKGTIAGIATGIISDVYGTITHQTRVDTYANWIKALITPTHSNSNGTVPPPDSIDIQDNSPVVRVNYRTKINNTIVTN
jgi:hypothetical protein